MNAIILDRLSANIFDFNNKNKYHFTIILNGTKLYVFSSNFIIIKISYRLQLEQISQF